jgi:hypothetical protein
MTVYFSSPSLATMSHTVQAISSSTDGLGKGQKAKIANKCRRKRGSFKGGYSHEMMQIKTNINFYKNVLRVAFPSGKKRRSTSWTSFSFSRLITEWHHDWKTKHAAVLSQIPPP